MTEILHLKVTGMTCGGCEHSVARVLLQTPGITHARASHRDEQVDVTYDPATVAPDLIRQTITSLGYSVVG